MWLSSCAGYTPTEILQLNLVSKEIQELQETQTLFCVAEDFFFGCLQKERSHKEQKQYKEQAVISIHSSNSFEDVHKQIDQHKATFNPFYLWCLYFSEDTTDLVMTFKLRELTLCFASIIMGSDGAYLPRFLVDDPKFEVIAYNVLIKCNNKL